VRNAGVWAAMVILIFSGFIFWESTKLEYEGSLGFGPGFIPYWLSIVLAILSIIYLVTALKEKIHISDIFPKNNALIDFVLIIGSMFLFILILEYTGFTIAGILSLALILYRTFKWYYVMLLSIGISVFIFLIFAKALTIPLPVNSLGW
jgi:putative tricarboxylic transport membrane protein